MGMTNKKGRGRVGKLTRQCGGTYINLPTWRAFDRPIFRTASTRDASKLISFSSDRAFIVSSVPPTSATRACDICRRQCVLTKRS